MPGLSVSVHACLTTASITLNGDGTYPLSKYLLVLEFLNLLNLEFARILKIKMILDVKSLVPCGIYIRVCFFQKKLRFMSLLSVKLSSSMLHILSYTYIAMVIYGSKINFKISRNWRAPSSPRKVSKYEMASILIIF